MAAILSAASVSAWSQDGTPTVAQQLDKLATTLAATQQQVEQSQAQIRSMQAEIDRLRGQLAIQGKPENSAVAVSSSATALENSTVTVEDLDVLRAEVRQLEQAKVESSSRLPVRLTGLVLFQSFVNQGAVDQIDLPTAALQTAATGGNTSTGASVRQTILGVEATGPVLWGARTSGRVSMDFFGGVTGSAASGPAGTIRLRTAAIAAAWGGERAHDVVEASYDTPLITPLSPESYATVAQPSQAWSGNLWTWAPQIAWTHRVPLKEDRSLSFQLGLLDTQTLNAANNFTQRTTGAGEASGQPSYETRVAYGAGPEERRFELGVGGIYGRQVYKFNQRIDTWAATADWRVPLGSRMRLAGELYRGRGLGSLGGGAYRNVVTNAFPNSSATYLRALDAEGGWVELHGRLTSTLSANASIGQDAASGAQLRNAVPAVVTNSIFFYGRNRNIVGNVIYRPWASVIFSPEYRRIESWQVTGHNNVANVYTFTVGYQF